MVFREPGRALEALELPIPEPGPGQLLVRVRACAVCRTDLHLLDGELQIASPPRVLGHQIIGTVLTHGPGSAPGPGARGQPPAPLPGALVGIPWLGWTCAECAYCREGRENLCARARFTGRDIDGGMAEYAVADARYCFELPQGMTAEQAAPLLCAGAIGYRALNMCGEARELGIYGFGAAGHIVAQIASWQGRRVFAFTREGDRTEQAFARERGASWAGSSQQRPPQALQAALIFAPVGALVPLALAALAPGGTVVCAGIHMSDIPSLPYAALWEERAIRSVANLTRQDARETLALAPQIPLRTRVSTYPLEQAGLALDDLRAGRLTGSAVLIP